MSKSKACHGYDWEGEEYTSAYSHQPCRAAEGTDHTDFCVFGGEQYCATECHTCGIALCGCGGYQTGKQLLELLAEAEKLIAEGY